MIAGLLRQPFRELSAVLLPLQRHELQRLRQHKQHGDANHHRDEPAKIEDRLPAVRGNQRRRNETAKRSAAGEANT